MAERVRKDRRPAAADNAFVKPEHAVSEQIEPALDGYREMRDRMQEQLPSRRSTTRPWSRRSPACGAACRRRPAARPGRARRAAARRPRSRRSRRARSRAASPKPCCASCSRWPRPSRCSMCAASGSPSGSSRSIRRCASIPREQMKAAAREQAFMLRFDQERALAALPQLMPDRADERALRPWTSCGGSATRTARSRPGSRAVLARIEERPRGSTKGRPTVAAAAASRDAGRRARARTAAAGGKKEKDQDPAEIAPPQKPAREYRVYPALIERCAELEPVTTAVAHPATSPRSPARSRRPRPT